MDGGYLGNQHLKKSGTDIEWTHELIEEYMKCAKDPVYFAKKYIKIVHVDKGLIPFEMYPYQEEIANKITNNRRVAVLTARQSGKTTTAVAVILHYILFNEFNLERIDRIFLVKTLEELGIIRIDEGLYSLTKEGLSFVSFEEIEKKEILKAEKEEIDLQLNKWLLKTKWLPHFFAFISFVFAVYVYFDSKNDLKKAEKRLEVIESIIPTQKNVPKK